MNLELDWNEVYEVKIPDIDDQHKTFFVIINEIYDILQHDQFSKEDTLEILAELEDFSAHHFKFEEEMLTKKNYPELEMHKNLHREYTEQVLKYKVAVESNKDAKDICMELLKFVTTWITKHIVLADHRYAKYFADNKIS